MKQGLWGARLRLVPRGSLRERVLRLIMRGLRVWRAHGFRIMLRKGGRLVRRTCARRERYVEWLAQDAITERVRGLVRADISHFSARPKLSIIMPVYNPPEKFLREAVGSVKRQLYENWDLCIADDASNQRVAGVVDDLARSDGRIKVFHRAVNGGISEATNSALAMASGEFVGLLDHDDLLSEDALYFVAKAISDEPDLDVIYTDKDHVTEDGTRTDPYFKPDWSPQALLCHNYVIHFLVFRRSLLDQVGLFRKEFDGAQDYDFILRLGENTRSIKHIARVLYSWRRHSGSNSLDPKPSAFDAAQRAVQEALVRRGGEAGVLKTTPFGPFRVSYRLRGRPPVNVIISSGGDMGLLRACLTSLTERTAYDNYELIIVTNLVGHKPLQEFCNARGLQLVEVRDGFFSKMNNAAAMQANGEFLVFLNDDTEVVTPAWMEEMLSLCQRPDVGAVGPKLVYPNGGVQFTRMVLGIRRDGVPYFFDPFGTYQTPMFFGFSSEVVSEVTALSGACMMVRRSEFLRVGGFDETEFNLSWQDLDLCLRLRKSGHWLLYTPHATLVHHGSVTKRRNPSLLEKDIKIANAFFNKHRDLLAEGDPFYNPNLSDVHAFIEPPRFPGIERIRTSVRLYDGDYWESYGFPLSEKGGFVGNRTPTVQSFLQFAAQVLRATGCRKVVDVGCGPGMLLEAFEKLGVDAWGIEVSPEAIAYIPPALREKVLHADICAQGEGILEGHRPFCAAICIEVLEHIAVDDLDDALRNITRLSDTVIVRTPKPNMWDRKDVTHLRVMARAFWVDRFGRVGFREDIKMARAVFGHEYKLDPDSGMFVFVRTRLG